MTLSRRNFVASGLCLPLIRLPEGSKEVGLRDYAEKASLIYGVAVDSNAVFKDEEYRLALRRDAGMLVAEGVMKRRTLEPKPGRFNFAPALALAAFAQKQGATLRGHTLLWHDANPSWLPDALQEGGRDALVVDYVSKVAGQFRGKLHSWDVINEVIAPDEAGENGMRVNSPWHKAFGEYYIDLAFHAARAADPGALLFYNELNLEGNIWWAEKRRTATLKLIERLKKRDVPIDGLGIQGHLKAYRVNYDQRVFSRFLEEVEGFGLKTLITELDVADIDGPKDINERDAFVASIARDVLNVAFENGSALGCLTWGLSDRYSWLSRDNAYKWGDGSLGRVLPYDQNFRKKPMYGAIEMAYRCAGRKL